MRPLHSCQHLVPQSCASVQDIAEPPMQLQQCSAAVLRSFKGAPVFGGEMGTDELQHLLWQVSQVADQVADLYIQPYEGVS